jgi:hypothetical protein
MDDAHGAEPAHQVIGGPSADGPGGEQSNVIKAFGDKLGAEK